MWEFANLMQYIYTFGKVVKIGEDLDIEVCFYVHVLSTLTVQGMRIFYLDGMDANVYG